MSLSDPCTALHRDIGSNLVQNYSNNSTSQFFCLNLQSKIYFNITEAGHTPSPPYAIYNRLMRLTPYILGVLLTSGVTTAQAVPFLSADRPERLFTLGVRAGFNTSNTTVGDRVFDRWNVNSWGLGTQLGAVATLHFRDWIGVQPGFFFETRTGFHSYDFATVTPTGQTSHASQFGHSRTYHFTVPVMASAAFNITDMLRLTAEAGPYVSFMVGSGDSDSMYVPYGTPSVDNQGAVINTSASGVTLSERRRFDAGLKAGAGLVWNRHWSVSVHYLAGGGSPWKPDGLGGRLKSWQFSLGYDF